MCVVMRRPCGNPAASHSCWVSANPAAETSHIATLQASATSWRTNSRPIPDAAAGNDRDPSREILHMPSLPYSVR